MKQSINPGSIKGLSLSPLRALSGDLKCTTAGQTAITYQWNLKFINLNNIGRVQAVLVGGGTTPPNGKPHAKWVCKVVSNITTPVPNTGFQGRTIDPVIRFSVTERPLSGEGYTATPVLFPANPNEWSKIEIVNTVFGTISNDPMNAVWQTAAGTITVGPTFSKGPELFEVASMDLSTAGSKTTYVILPEQFEMCTTHFLPFWRDNLFFPAPNPTQFQATWNSVVDGFENVVNFVVNPVWLLNSLPLNTAIGMLTMTFIRIETHPLFTWTIPLPRKVSFINKTFFNAALAPVWDWDFGDGTAHSALQTPAPHTYAAAGTYHVVLTVTDPLGGKTFDQYVIIT